MKPASYWKKRFEALEQAQHAKSAAYVRGRMRRQFEHAMAQIEKELTAWYTKTAENNEISMAGARRMLTASEQQELQWSLDEYRAKCKEYAAKYKLGTKDEHLLQQLRNVTAKQAVTRLDALNLQLRMQLEDLYANHAGSMKEHLSDAYKESYYRSAYEIEKGMGVGAALHEMETKRAEMALAKPWVSDGKTFSDRIWKDKNKLVRTLQTELPQQFVRGESLPRIVKKVSERMSVAQSSASRLVMTESAFFATAGERETMNALDVKQFEFVATLDDRTSETCRDMDGKHFPLKDLKVGENAPPLHCWCRSCIVPYFGDAKDVGRAARNPVKDKTEIVPADMTYPEWKSVYVDKEKTLDEWKNECASGTIQVEVGGMYRKKRNAPPFDEISLPMQEKTIKQVCREFDLKTSGLQLKIQRDEALLPLPMTGSTDYDNVGRIDLFPNAFKSKEELVKTIIHESAHVMQVRKYGKAYAQKHLDRMEAIAYRFEAFYYHIKRGDRK